jgi:hypothetical protein
MNNDNAWMRTFTGRKFWPLDPNPEDVDIFDIAHALSMKCRYGGHSRRFYSVAEHSVRMARAASFHNKFAALMHDASEYVLPDLIRPIKKMPEVMAFWRPIEDRVEKAISAALRVPYPYPEEVHALDRSILTTEMMELVPYGDWLISMPARPDMTDEEVAEFIQFAEQDASKWRYGPPLRGIIPSSLGWLPALAEALFMDAYFELMPGKPPSDIRKGIV